jgi:flagellar basal-body rod modification protein FlgD
MLGASATLSGDLDTFLKLLTAQIRNQDPMEPTDATQYASQLATFSNVEQAVRTNEILEGLAQMLDGQDVTRLAEWVGREVRHSGSFRLGEVPLTLEGALPGGADAGHLVIQSQDGREVARLPVDPGAERHVWTGESGAGTRVQPGYYAARLIGSIGGAEMEPVTPVLRGRVEEAALRGDAAVLLLEDGTEVSPADVLGVR